MTKIEQTRVKIKSNVEKNNFSKKNHFSAILDRIEWRPNIKVLLVPPNLIRSKTLPEGRVPVA